MSVIAPPAVFRHLLSRPWWGWKPSVRVWERRYSWKRGQRHERKPSTPTGCESPGLGLEPAPPSGCGGSRVRVCACRESPARSRCQFLPGSQQLLLPTSGLAWGGRGPGREPFGGRRSFPEPWRCLRACWGHSGRLSTELPSAAARPRGRAASAGPSLHPHPEKHTYSVAFCVRSPIPVLISHFPLAHSHLLPDVYYHSCQWSVWFQSLIVNCTNTRGVQNHPQPVNTGINQALCTCLCFKLYLDAPASLPPLIKGHFSIVLNQRSSKGAEKTTCFNARFFFPIPIIYADEM